MHLIFPETSHWPSFVSLDVWVYVINSFKFVQWAPKDASFVQQSAFWPCKVIQGRWFWYQSKARMDFLFVPHCDYGPTLHRLWDTASYLAKIAYFSYPSLIRRPRSLCSVWNFPVKLTVRKLETWGYHKWRPHDRSLSRFDMISNCDGRTDGRTESVIANTALCITSYANAL